MNISLTPDMYTPSVDEHGNYVDGSHVLIRDGIRCPCGSRRDKIYGTSAQFTTHTKSKCHQNWLRQLNRDKANYYVELLNERAVNESQQKIIAQLNTKISNNLITINYLTQQLIVKENVDVDGSVVADLLDIN